FDLVVGLIKPEQTRLNPTRDGQADDGAEEGPEHAGCRSLAEVPLEKNHGPGQQQAKPGIHEDVVREGLEDRRRIGHCRHEKNSRECKPGHVGERYHSGPVQGSRSASSASPTVRTPTSSQSPSKTLDARTRSAFARVSPDGSMFASGMTHRRN